LVDPGGYRFKAIDVEAVDTAPGMAAHIEQVRLKKNG